MNILLVEDDPVIGESLRTNLEIEGFGVYWAKDLADVASRMREERPDLIILDLSLPDGYGLNLCRQLRGEGFQPPILILSAEGDVDAIVKSFECGANDYIRKPFSNRELVARVRAHDSQNQKRPRALQWKGLLADPTKRIAYYREDPLPLNRREFDLLLLLLEQPEAVIRREIILEKLAGGEEILERTIDSHVSHLRGKLRQAGVPKIRIRTEYGVGYRLVADE